MPQGPADPFTVLEELVERADPGIVASAGPRYFGFVTGGAVPVTVAADWLASAWDQNAALYVQSPAMSVMEDIVAGWVLELLDFRATPASASSPAATWRTSPASPRRGTKCCAAPAGTWKHEGLQRAPRVRVLVGDEAHISAIGALRYLGFGSEELEVVAVDDQGRMRADALDARARRTRAAR